MTESVQGGRSAGHYPSPRAGVGGVGLGALTPLFVLIFNTLGWSFPAYAYFRLNGEHPVA